MIQIKLPFLLVLLTFTLLRPWEVGAVQTPDSAIDLRSGSLVPLNLDEASKKRVFIFVSSVCPCSTSHTSLLNDLNQKYEEKGFQFLGVHSNSSEDKSDAIAFYSSNYEFPILHDSDQQIKDHFKAIKTPQAFVVSDEGEVLYLGSLSNSRNATESTENHLELALSQITAGDRVDPKRRKPLGCIID